MASSLSNLVNNFSEEIHKMKCKYGHDDKKNLKLGEYDVRKIINKSLMKS